MIYKKFYLLGLSLFLLGCANKTNFTVNERQSLLNTKFPVLEAETLAKNKIEFPKDNIGKVTIYAIAFEGDAQKIVDTWTKPILDKYSNNEVNYFEIPMISGAYSIMKKVIDNGMRGGVPVNLHNNVATYYGSLSEYKTNLKMNNKDTIYMYLLDKNGKICWLEEGYATEEKLNAMYEKIRSL